LYTVDRNVALNSNFNTTVVGCCCWIAKFHFV